MIAHHLPHRRLRHVAERLRHVADVEEVGAGVLDPELHDPLDHGHVEIAGQHHRLRPRLRRVRSELGALAGARGTEPELHLELSLHGHLGHGLHERYLQVRPGLGRARIGAEPLDDADLVRLDLVVPRDEQDERTGDRQEREARAGGQPRHGRQAHLHGGAADAAWVRGPAASHVRLLGSVKVGV